MWRVDSRTDAGRWFEHDGAGWAADPSTRLDVLVLNRGPQPLTPTGPFYEPTGPDDEIALFLVALGVVPAPQVSGTPPTVPTVPHPHDDVVY